MVYANYLVQYPTGLYVFRLKVPADLRPVIGKTEIRKSLKTHDKLKAQIRAIRLMAVCKNLFNQIRKGNSTHMTPDEMNKVLDIWTQEILAEDEEDRITRKPLTSGQIDDEISNFAMFKADCREQLATSDYQDVAHVADMLINDHNLEATHFDRKKLCREILKRSVTIYGILEKRAVGDYIEFSPSGNIGIGRYSGWGDVSSGCLSESSHIKKSL